MSLAATESRPTASVEEVLAEADKIWARVARAGVPAGDAEKNDALFAELQEEFGNFSRSFPVVLRWMVQLRKYSRRALNVFLLKHATAPLATEDDFLALQAEYPVQFYAHDGKGSRAQKKVAAYRAGLLLQLKEERDAFEAAKKEADALEAERKAKASAARRETLYRLLRARGAEPAGGGGGAPRREAGPVAEPRPGGGAAAATAAGPEGAAFPETGVAKQQGAEKAAGALPREGCCGAAGGGRSKPGVEVRDGPPRG